MADDKINVKIDGDSSTFVKEADKAQSAVGGIMSKIGGVKALFVGAIAAAGAFAGALIKGAITSAAKLQDTQVQFEVLTGSVDKAKVALTQLQDFSAKTPFQFDDVAAAGRVLLSFGFAADDLTDKLQKIGDVAAASGSDLKEIALIYGQVAAAGKLTGERLLQLQERGINIGPALAKSLGVAEKSVKDLVSKGKVDLAEFEKAFAALSGEGGFAFGGLDKQSQTLNGAISTMKDNWEQVSRTLGAVFVPAATEVVGWLTKIAQGVNSLFGEKSAQDIAGGLVDRIGKLGEAIAFFQKEQEGKSKDSVYFKGLEGEISSRKKEIDELNKQLDEIAKKQLKTKKEPKPQDEVSKNLLEQERQYQIERGNLLDSFREENNILDAESDEERLMMIQENFEREKELKEIARADELAAKGQFLEAQSALDDLANEKYKQQLASRVKLDQTFGSQRVAIANQVATLITTIFGAENKAAFLISKGAALAQAAIDKGKADMGALAASRTLPPFIAEGYYGQAVALNNLQFGLSSAIIGAQTLKGFADGGVIGGIQGASVGGDNRMATVRDGEMVLNAGQQETLFNAIQGGNLGGGFDVIINVNDDRFADVFEAKIVQRKRLGISRL